ncbi:MAG TPA: pyridoxal-phosphate dependent enzyme [Polyangiaceae bacterium]|nr:pyridoxal-phosphate dependent enzyme [Polyangiaceae bacterium]
MILPRPAEDCLQLGSYPTPLRKIEIPGPASGDLWIKDDGQSAQAYGGNKVRKLERLLALAQRSGARRLLTIGAAGSHHVLATCVFGRRLGLPTRAVLTPQPWTPHAEDTLRAALNSGLSAVPASSGWDAVQRLRRERSAGDFVIGPGGWGSAGTWAYRLAVDELREQLAEAGVAELDGIVVAAGSGSTAAGLLAGILETRGAQRVIAVQVTPNPLLRALILGQASLALWRRGRPLRTLQAFRCLEIERGFVGDGYGHAIERGDAATELARSFGLALEPTYTAKAFAAALARVGASSAGEAPPQYARGTERRKLQLHRRQAYLYWHTLSSVPLTALLTGAPTTLPNELSHLLRRDTPDAELPEPRRPPGNRP